jgi:hypothetical protein
MPPQTTATLQYLSGHRRYFVSWGGPMNGQTARLEIVREIIEKCGIKYIVETGTFRGGTTEWFANFGIPVSSVELNKKFAFFARRRLRRFRQVNVVQANSVDGLKSLVAAGRINHDTNTLFYLDAHWNEYLPLADELSLVRKHARRSVIVVDDFRVEDDEHYGFADYGPDKVLATDYLAANGVLTRHVFFPATAAAWETGRRRGCVVLTDDDEFGSILEHFPLLRRWEARAEQVPAASLRRG